MTDAKKPWEQQFDGGASGAGSEPWKQDYGPDAADAPAGPRGLKGWGRDIAATAVKGAIAVPEALVGLADIPTGGRVGKFLENEGGAVGFRPKQAKEQVNEWHSDATKEAQRKFQEADGVWDKTVAAIQNPSNIAVAVGESLAPMGLGGVAARGLMAATRLGQMGTKGAVLAGAAGEGATMAGSQAEQIRQETNDGLLNPTQAGLAVATGLAGGAFGVAGGKVAQRLGIGDADTMLAQGIKGVDEQIAGTAARAAANPLVADAAVKSIPRKVIEGAIAEGFLEELPQSMAEQIFQNIALDKPWHEDLDSAAVMGVLSGGAMGAGAAGFRGVRESGATPAGEPAPAPGADAGSPKAEAAAQPNPGLARVSSEFAARLQALQEQEQGEAQVPQTAPPDGAAALAQQQAQAKAARDAEMAASRAVESPDDEILQSTGATAPRPSEAMGLRSGPEAGSLENAAAISVDTGATAHMQQAAAQAQAAEVAAKQSKVEPKKEAKQGVFEPGQQWVSKSGGSYTIESVYADGKMGLADFGNGEKAQVHFDAESANGWTLKSNQKQEQRTQGQQAVDPDTGEISGMPSMSDWSDVDLSTAFRHAQSKDVRRQLATELSRRRALRTEAEQAAAVQPESKTAQAPAAQQPVQPVAPGSQADGANVATLAQLNRKKLAEMSTDELHQLSSLLPADHSRQQKIQKAIQSLAQQAQVAINEGAKPDGTQTPEAKQSSAQPAQAGAAQASASAAQGVNARATPAQHHGAQAPFAPAAKSQAASPQAAPANQVGAAESIAKEGNAQREQERQRLLDASERWTRMTTAERQAVAGSAPGLNVIARKNLHTRAWADMSEKTRAKLVESLVNSTASDATKAPAAIKSEAKTTPEAAASQIPVKKEAQPMADAKQFAAETGTLGIPRAEMPQVPTASHGGLVKHLNAKGITHETKTVDAAELKPTQAEYSPAKVEAAKSASGDRAVIVSSDGHIIDGHHQAVAAAEEGKQVKAIVLDAPVEQALAAVKASPSANAAAPATLAASVQEQPDSGDFPMSEAVQSYSGISHSGRSRADGDKQAFDKFMESAHSAAEKLATTDAQRDALAAATESLRADYLKQYRSLMSVRAGAYSGFVAGRGNLNSKQADSRNSALDKAMERFDSWVGDNADRVSKAVLAARTPEQVKADRAATAARIQEKADKKAADIKATLLKFLSFKSGDNMPYGKGVILTKVSYDRDGYPTSLTFKMADGSPLIDDKLDLLGTLKDKDETLEQAKVRIRGLVDEVRAENPELTKGIGAMRAAASAKAAKAAMEPAPATVASSFLDRHNKIEDGISAGTLALDDYKSAFAELESNQDAVLSELQQLTKDKLLRAGGPAFAYRMGTEKKDAIVLAAYQKMLDTYALGRSYGPSFQILSAASIAKNQADKAQALRELVGNTTAEDLTARAAEIKARRDEFKAKRAAEADALANPKTLQDFRGFMSHWVDQGDTSEAAYLRLTPEQRQQFDALEAEQTKDQREAEKRRARVTVQSAGNTTAGEIIATKHTKHGHDLFVVQLAERVERDAYDTLNSSAKRLGGSYSSYRGNGAVPGFQFRTREAAEAFQKLVAGDTAQAQDLANQRRDAFEDDKSQTTVERLRAMAEALDQGADEQLGAERKTNTVRRARMANAAEDAARGSKAYAATMRNLADAIEAGKVQFLDGVRTKTQLTQLLQALDSAKVQQIMAKHGSWVAVEENKHAPMDAQTVDFAEFPRFTMYRSDLAGLARQLLDIEGGKKMGAALARLADDVTEAYTSWAKDNLLAVSHFGNKTKGGFADFASKDMAERAIKRSGLVGKAVVLQVKRGQNRIVLSPGEAMQQGLWQGDGDKRIQLGMEFVEDLAKLGKRKGSKVLALPWQLESTLEKRQRLQRMGIQTPAEFRSALRELQNLRQERAEPNRITQLERAMVGRANDGLDFFPTSPAVVQTMLDAAEIAEGMAVLEPSAGMGHIADAIVAESGVWPDVVELSPGRREVLEVKGYQLAAVNDFTQMEPRGFFTFGDSFRAPDGVEGVMRGAGGMGSQRVRLEDEAGNRLGLYNRDELTGIAQNGALSGYDRIIMNPPFSDGRDIQHVMHAYSLLRPGGRIVAIMGEGAFFQSNKRAEGFREWLDELGATNEKLPDGSFMDPSLPVNTGVAARMVVIDKPASDQITDGRDAPSFRRQESELAGADFDVASFLQGMNEGQPGGAASASVPAMNVRPRYSPAARAEAVRVVTGTVDAIRQAWANGPDVIVAFDMQDPVVPESARRADLKQRSGGARGAPEGFYYQDKVYLMASKLKTPSDAARVLFHEALGHHGLRGLFGKELGLILNQVAAMRKADVDAKIVEYGLRHVNRLDRRTAAEEVLAEMAQNTPQIGFVRRAVAAIRTWLRTHVPRFKSLALTDDELIRNFILPARAWVERGAPDGGDKADATFSREDAPEMRTAANFLQARQAVKEFQGKPLTNAVTGMQAVVSRKTLDKMLSSKAVSKSESATAHATAVANVDHLFEQAIWGWSKPDRDADTNFEAIHRFFAPMTYGDKQLLVKLTVKEVKLSSQSNPLYTVEAVELNESKRGKQWVEQAMQDDGLDLQKRNPLQREWADEIAGEADPNSTLARPHGMNPGRSAEDVHSLAQAIERSNTDEPMFSRSHFADLKESALDQLNKTFTHEGKVSLWDKSVGTMRHLAERAPSFKPVYESAQQNIDDVSMLANDAADMAPRILPRVESLGDLKKKPVSAADNKAVARPLFEGTLIWARDENGKPALVDDLQKRYASLTVHNKAAMLLKHGRIEAGMLANWQSKPLAQFENLINSRFESKFLKAGIVWFDPELQAQFGMDANQISLYREARAAIDRSIDMTARTDMLRVVGDKYEAMREAVLAQPSVESAAQLLLDTLEQDAKADPDSADRLGRYMQQIKSRMETAADLQAKGYAPLSRFGRFTVDVVDANGERQYFGMYESQRDSNLAKMQLAQEFKGATITQGTMSAEAYKLFAGVTPETLEQFGEMLGLKAEGNEAQDKAFQEFLKLTKNNHSAMKRLIHRKGIAGFSEDVGRVVANFVYSNARAGAMGLNAGKMETAIGKIPKEQGELKDLAMGLRDYIRDPQEEGQAVRGMLFAQYLGGSIASAFVNTTQPFAVTLPWLSQYGGMKKAGAQLARALKDMGTKGFKYEADLAKALKSAEDDGVVSPQEIHQLMAQARGAGMLRSGDGTKVGDTRAKVSNLWEQGKVLWGQPFALAEQFNRRSTFIAAYRTAKEQGMADPAAFARNAVIETQFQYSKANKPRWARGTVGGTLFTFKTYSVSYLELMQRMWAQGGPEGRRAVGWSLAMLLLMSGAGGVPFMEDAEDLIDGAGQLMGYNISAKQWRKELLASVVGKELGEFMEQGLSGLPGAPVDVSGRLGMGNLIPGTGLFLNKPNRERDLLEIAGPAGDLVSRGFGGARKLLSGDVAGAALDVSPTAVRNLAKGADMAATGMYRDSKGYKVIDTTLAEAAAKAIGFQPKLVAEVQEANSFMQRSKSFYIQTSNELKAQWAQAIFDKDDSALQRVRDRLEAWNRDNPEQPIVVKIPDVMKRVREMGKDRTQRIADTAPKALRQQMREMAQEAGR